MQSVMAKSGGYFIAMILALVAFANAVDAGFAVHMAIFALSALTATLITMRNADPRGQSFVDAREYDDDPIRWG